MNSYCDTTPSFSYYSTALLIRLIENDLMQCYKNSIAIKYM